MQHKSKTENKICKPNIKMICKTKTKQDNLLEGKDGQDDAHVGATSPTLKGRSIENKNFPTQQAE